MAAQFVSGTPATLGSLSGIKAPATDFTVDMGFDGNFVVQSTQTGSDPSIWLKTVSATGNTVAPQFRWVAGGRNFGGIQEDTLSLFSYDAGIVEAGIVRTGVPGVIGSENTFNHRSNGFTPAAWNPAVQYAAGAYAVNAGQLWLAVAPTLGVAPAAPAWSDRGAWVVGQVIALGQCGTITIAGGDDSATIYVPALNDNAAVVLASISGNAAPDDTLKSIENILIDAADPNREQHSITIQCNDDATAAVRVCWWIPTISTNFW
jgi:hypothetical protein